MPQREAFEHGGVGVDFRHAGIPRQPLLAYRCLALVGVEGESQKDRLGRRLASRSRWLTPEPLEAPRRGRGDRRGTTDATGRRGSCNRARAAGRRRRPLGGTTAVPTELPGLASIRHHRIYWIPK